MAQVEEWAVVASKTLTTFMQRVGLTVQKVLHIYKVCWVNVGFSTKLSGNYTLNFTYMIIIPLFS